MDTHGVVGRVADAIFQNWSAAPALNRGVRGAVEKDGLPHDQLSHLFSLSQHSPVSNDLPHLSDPTRHIQSIIWLQAGLSHGPHSRNENFCYSLLRHRQDLQRQIYSSDAMVSIKEVRCQMAKIQLYKHLKGGNDFYLQMYLNTRMLCQQKCRTTPTRSIFR